jgi:hypothetical protein
MFGLPPEADIESPRRACAAVARRLRTPEVLEQLRGAPNRVVLYNVMVGRTGVYRSQ